MRCGSFRLEAVIRPEPLTDDAPHGEGLPAALAGIEVVDAHVHLFPDALFAAIHRWFDTHAWPIRYRMTSDGVLDFLEARGVKTVVALHYAHKPGIARSLNDYVLALAKRRRGVIPTATVMPGEPDAAEILRRALGEGARGVKIHCHVQKVAPDEPRMDDVWREAARAGVPVVIHAGREPSSDAYGVDCRALCSAASTARALERHPEATCVVPHLGSDEVAEYLAMLDRFPRLHLDTTMVVAEYFPLRVDAKVLEARADRLLYGTDFPNLPYPWDREAVRLASAVSRPAAEKIFSANARRLFTSAR